MNSSRSAIHEDDMALDLAGLLRALGGAMRWLLPLVLTVAVGTFVALQFVPAKYKGEARVIIESKDGDYPGATRGVEEERALLDNEGVSSQVQLLMSADLARRVAKRLSLASVPEFKAGGSEGLVSDALVMLGLARDPNRISPEERVLKVFYKNLDVYRIEDSRVIAVEFSSQNPELAAAVANTIVDEYIALQSSAKRETTEIATTSLEPQIERMKAEVQAARKAAEDFRARADLFVGADNLTLNQQQLGEISSSYSEAQATKAESQAKADLIRALLNSGGSLETASDVLDSLLIQRLRERQVELQANIAELSITLLPNHPQLKALQSQLSDYDRQIRSEARKILVGLENDAKVATQQAEALKARLGELKTAAAKTNSDQVRLSELEREANAKARQLDEMISSFRDADTRLRAQVLPADARIVSRAAIPAEPHSPKVTAITIVATLVTFLLGCGYVIMREFLSGNILYAVDYGSRSGRHGDADDDRLEPMAARGASSGAAWGGAPAAGVSMTSTCSFGGYREAAARYVNDVVAAPEADPVRRERHPEPVKKRGIEPEGRDGTSGRRDSQGDEREDDRETAYTASRGAAHADRAVQDALEPAPTLTSASADAPAEGMIVVLSVDDPALSHDKAFALARMSADAGIKTLMMEVFPDMEMPNAADGFSDLVAGDAAFSQIVYADPRSDVHIIEAGTLAIDDEMAGSGRFMRALDAICSTYEAVIVDLGAIDGSLASASFLRNADRVLLMSKGEVRGRELESAANLLAYNTGAEVEVVVAVAENKGKGTSGQAA